MKYEQFVYMLESDYHISSSDNIIEYDELQRVCEREKIPFYVYDIIEEGELVKMLLVALEGELYVGYATRDGHSDSGKYSLCSDNMKVFDKKEIYQKMDSTKKFFENSLDRLEQLLIDDFVNQIVINETFRSK